jgi:hypothetical protein
LAPPPTAPSTTPTRRSFCFCSYGIWCQSGRHPFAEALLNVLRRLPAAKTPDQVRALLPDVWQPA